MTWNRQNAFETLGFSTKNDSGNRTMPHEDVLDRLMVQLHDRAIRLPEGSYTTQLIRGGIPKIAQKILEEANEVIEAAGEPGEAGRDHTIREACDVLFHLWVLLAVRGVGTEDLRKELERREGVSGLQEKASRTQPHPKGITE
jgi:phosphoribosyl-ATP pyrophosphohydrolase